jgi:hypothetical protein
VMHDLVILRRSTLRRLRHKVIGDCSFEMLYADTAVDTCLTLGLNLQGVIGVLKSSSGHRTVSRSRM